MTELKGLWRAARKLGRHRVRGKTLPPLLFFTDPARNVEPIPVMMRMPRGSGVVFRAFGARDARVQGAELARLARRRRLVFIVGADIALAVALRADGIHLPERAAHKLGLNRRFSTRFTISAAAHGQAAIRKARLAGIDAVVVSPVFPSSSPSAGPPIGAVRFAAWTNRARLPVYALGGITSESARRLFSSGAVGFAAVGAFRKVNA